MSKQNFLPNQRVYTVGYSSLPDGTQLAVSESHRGDQLVSCLNGLKQYHFIDQSKLVLVKPVAKKVSVPAWVQPLGVMGVSAGRMLFVFGHDVLPDNSIVYIADGYIHNTVIDEVRCVLKNKTPWEFHSIPKSVLYLNTSSMHNNPVAKPLASEFKEFTEDHKYMIELLKEPSRAKVIDLVLQGVVIDDYDIVTGPKYYILIPKTPTTLFMPMIMAHTDIQQNVAHPGDNLQYDPATERFSSPIGLGADDRAGCYAINKILLNHPGKFIIALFDEEEIGCIGSSDFVKDKEFAKIDKKASCYISIDRKRGYGGVGQIATYGHDNTKLFTLVKTATGRLAVKGSSTDCRTLAAGSKALAKNKGLACFNMSCGYENEHTSSEALYFKELQAVVTDFDCLVLSAPELWTEQFNSVIVKQTYTSTNAYLANWADAEIQVDGDYYDESDVRTLLWYYEQTTGKAYIFAKATGLCKEFEKNNYVRLDPECMTSGVYGGKKLTKDLYTELKAYTWVVTSISGMLCDLQSECASKTASNIPFAWLKLITISDPLVETN